MSDFYQDPPRLSNTYSSNRLLRAYLSDKLPKAIFAEVDADLKRFGELCAGEFMELARTAEREKPVHVPYDPWGRRVDEIRVSSAWTEFQKISAREGLVALGYARKQGEHSRLFQFAKLYLFHPSSAFFTCPLAMADGAARVLEKHGEIDVHREAFARLTSDRAGESWTSGQWMTEKTGGSDVSGTSTVAREIDGQMRLFGTKWFSSATTSEMALALARPEDAPSGSRGLSLYFVPMRGADGALNGLRVRRLKDKLGTWALPTAELELEGALAYPIGPAGQGVKTVTTMLNITRLYNSVCSVGAMTRGLELMRDYASKREVFGAKLADQPLHRLTFAREEQRELAAFLLTMELVRWLGREEVGVATPDEAALLRLLTPVCKLFTARAAVRTASEVIEGFGGAGYIEDTGLPSLLRDSQVFPIWEGATNVLSLDMLRALDKARSALGQLLRSKLGEEAGELEREIERFAALPEAARVEGSRDFAFYLGRIFAYACMVEWARTGAHGSMLEPWIEAYRASGYLTAGAPIH